MIAVLNEQTSPRGLQTMPLFGPVTTMSLMALMLVCLGGIEARGQDTSQRRPVLRRVKLQPPVREASWVHDWQPSAASHDTLPDPQSPATREPVFAPLGQITLDLRPADGRLPDDHASRALRHRWGAETLHARRPWPASLASNYALPLRFPVFHGHKPKPKCPPKQTGCVGLLPWTAHLLHRLKLPRKNSQR